MHDVMARRWPWVALTALLLGACESIPPSGEPPWRVVAVAEEAEAPEPVAPTPAAVTPPEPEAPDVPGEEPSEVAPVAPEASAPEAAEADTLALQAMLLGKPAPATPPPAFPPPSESAPASAAPEARAEVWDPESPLPEATFGVRVLSTLSNLQPPRAVLGLPDGSETVVQAGTILPDQQVIVMAIGRDVVQLARVVPQGYYARIETQNVQSLFPTDRGDGSR